MKKFSIPCNFGGKKAPFDVYIGNPKIGNHPLQNQSNWLQAERGGSIPSDIWESFAKLLELSEKNGVPFEDLCTYALEKSNNEKKAANQPAAKNAASSAQKQAAPTNVMNTTPRKRQPDTQATPPKQSPTDAMQVATAKIPASEVPDSDVNKQQALAAAQQRAQVAVSGNKPTTQQTPAPENQAPKAQAAAPTTPQTETAKKEAPKTIQNKQVVAPQAPQSPNISQSAAPTTQQTPPSASHDIKPKAATVQPSTPPQTPPVTEARPIPKQEQTEKPKFVPRPEKTPQAAAPRPATAQPTPQAAAPRPATAQPTPQAAAPRPATAQPTPQAAAPRPATAQPTPQAAAPRPATAQPTPQAAAPRPATAQPTPQAAAPRPAAPRPAPQAAPRPAAPKPATPPSSSKKEGKDI